MSKLDTIILTQLTCRHNPDFEFAYTIFNNKVYYTYAHILQAQKVKIYVMNLSTYEIDSICFKQKKKDIVPYARRFTISDEYLVISGHKSFSVYKYNQTSDNYGFLTKVNEVKYYDLWLDKDMLKLAYCYNYYLDEDKAGFGLYDLAKKEWVVQKKLNTNGIYFTHFTPSQLLAFNGNSILELDPIDYQIILYDSSGRNIDSFSRNISDWRSLDLRIQKRLNDNLKTLSAKEVIGYLNLHRLKIDRCQQIISFAPDSFLVSYYRYDTADKNVEYAVDYYSVKQNKIDLIRGGVKDIASNDSVLRMNCDFPSMHTYNAHIISGKNLVILRNVAPINYWNKTVGEISRIEEDYFKNNDGVLALFLFRLNI